MSSAEPAVLDYDADAPEVRLAALLDQLGVAAILVDAKARVVATSSAAGELLDRGDGLECCQGRLIAATCDQTRALRDLVAGALETGARFWLSLERSLSRPLGLCASALPDPRGEASVLVQVFDPEVRGLPEPEALRALWNLTPCEARVASRLAGGYSPDQIAEELGVQVNTCRRHLKGVFAKTGTHRQAELVALLSRTAQSPAPGQPMPFERSSS